MPINLWWHLVAKLFWFQAILKHVCRGQQEISFEELIDDMIANAWYMVTEYHLNLCPRDTLEKAVNYISSIRMEKRFPDSQFPGLYQYQQIQGRPFGGVVGLRKGGRPIRRGVFASETLPTGAVKLSANCLRQQRFLYGHSG
ncbi:MAG: hypothetical protein J5938_01740 [Clostridia bacterium]|nr:hypothetical protein [Clostridia bacterium]